MKHDPKQHHTSDSKPTLRPPTWLIILIVGLPLFSETVYSPALPDIATALSVSDAWVEYTLTIYLIGFAMGTFFWGNLSDKWGRKPCLIMGLSLYLVGCVGCYLSDSITWLMVNRLIQAIGGSSGSVLGQAITRDSFHGPALGKVYATVGTALSIFPAIGPILGGVIDQGFGWSAIFLFLIFAGVLVLALTSRSLAETHPHASRQRVSMRSTVRRMAQDKKVIGFGLLVASGNGIGFSYYAEGPFYMMELLGLTPSEYGLTFVGIALAFFVGGLINRKLHSTHDSLSILGYGLTAALIGGLLLAGLVVLIEDKTQLMVGTLTCLMIMMGGIAMINNNSMSLALVNYKNCIGTASSLFGCFYYAVASLFTLGMGSLHMDHTALPMPLFFLGIAVFMVFVRGRLIRSS